MFVKILFNVLIVLCSISLASSRIIIDCTYTNQTFNKYGSLYTCTAGLYFLENTKDIVDVSNNHLDGLDNNDVKALIFNENVDFTPRGISSFFPNLLVFRLFNKGSKELPFESLAGLNDLRYLDIARNKLDVIEPDLFSDNPLLEHIYLELNPIRHVAHNAFDHLNNLETLHMEGTTCISVRADTTEEINDLIFRLTMSCPATFAMTEAKIVNGLNLQNTIDTRIKSETNPIVKMLIEIAKQQKILRKRVDILETGGNS